MESVLTAAMIVANSWKFVDSVLTTEQLVKSMYGSYSLF